VAQARRDTQIARGDERGVRLIQQGIRVDLQIVLEETPERFEDAAVQIRVVPLVEQLTIGNIERNRFAVAGSATSQPSVPPRGSSSH
jgi:hypothetical protein